MAQMTPAQRFLMMTQGRQPRPVANMMRQYQTPAGITPRMALQRPQPPAPAMPVAPRLSPMMQRVAQQAAMPRMTPSVAGAGATTPPAITPPAGGQPSGFMGAFSQPLTSPVGQAISQAAIAGARASDYSPTPVSLGRVLAEMGAGAMQGYTSAQDRGIKNLLAQAQLAKALRPETTTLMQNLAAAGIDPSSPEGQQIIRDSLTKAGASITIDQKGQLAFDKLSSEYAFKKLGDTDKAIANVRTIESELEVIDSLLAGGAETGRIENALIPLKQLLKEFNLLSDEEAQELGTAELLQRSISRIIPNMRVAGSGSTSDYEMRMFAMAAPMFSRTTLGNRKIARGMLQVIEFNKERRRLMDDYMADEGLGNGTLRGFDRWADEKQGKLFKTFKSGDPDAEDAYKKAYQDGDIKVGDLVFNGSDFVFVTEESVQ